MEYWKLGASGVSVTPQAKSFEEFGSSSECEFRTRTRVPHQQLVPRMGDAVADVTGTMSHKRTSQSSFFKESSLHRHSHGGDLRKKRKGRGARPLATNQALHVVFKINRSKLRLGGLRTGSNFRRVNEIIERYAKRFFIKIGQLSVQGDHVHLLIRTTRRSHFHYFFRVVAGQIAQRFISEGRTAPTDEGTGLWKGRPFSRVITPGRRAYRTIQNYIQLNEQEALGRIPYRKSRLRGLSLADWEILWRS